MPSLRDEADSDSRDIARGVYPFLSAYDLVKQKIAIGHDIPQLTPARFVSPRCPPPSTVHRLFSKYQGSEVLGWRLRLRAGGAADKE